MKPHPRQKEQDDLLRPRLTEMIDMRHELAKLAALIDWEFFEREWAGVFPSHRGRPATSPRLVAGLLYLQHAWRLSDEAVVARWVENPCYQHFTGEIFFQHRPPIDPSSLKRLLRRRSAIEPEIGHMKTDGRLSRCPLKGTTGDAVFAVLCGCGQPPQDPRPSQGALDPFYLHIRRDHERPDPPELPG